jgi:phosphoglycolate phosphatase-like HAD superfamily hydrolase
VPGLLVLFDIDGTLIRRAGPHHRQALEGAVERVLGVRAPADGIPTQGMLDGDILARMLETAGVGARTARMRMPELMAEAQRLYRRDAPRDLRAKVCPGARAVLHRLRRRSVPAGLVTGNLSGIAWRKMRSTGLRPFLRFGAFAESASSRAGLVRLALAEARRRGLLGPRTRVWLAGDHPNDILAAKANSVGSIAVATGLSTHGELLGHSPDLLLDDLRSLELEKL